MSTIETNKISSNELDVNFVINNTKFIVIPIFYFEKKQNSKIIQNAIMNVVYHNNKSKTIFATKFSLEINRIALKFISQKKPNEIVGIWKQKTKQLLHHIPTSDPNFFYLTKEYNPYDAPVTKSLVIIDEKLKLPIPKHPMEYNIFSNGFNRFFTNKYFKKYFK